MFYVVEFKTTKEVAVIPSQWEEDGVCKWPGMMKSDRVIKAVKKAEAPGLDWTLYSVRILLRADTYDLARAKLPLAEEMSDLQTDDDLTTRKRIRTQPRRFSSSSEEDDVEDVRAVRISQPPRKTLALPPSPPQMEEQLIPSTSDLTPLSSPRSVSQHRSDVHVPPSLTNGGSSSTDLLQNVLIGQQQIMQMLRQHDLLLHKINSQLMGPGKQGGGTSAVELPAVVSLPLETMEELDELEQRLKDVEFKRNMTTYLGLVGGGDVKETVWRLLGKLVHNLLARSINWTGVNGKRAFKDLSLQVVVTAAVRKNSLTTKATNGEIEASVKRWFQLSGDRAGGRRARQERAQRPQSQSN